MESLPDTDLQSIFYVCVTGIYSSFKIYSSTTYTSRGFLISDTSAIIGTRSFALVTITNLIRLAVSYLIRPSVPDLIWLGVFWLDSTPGARIYFLFKSHNSSPITVRLHVVPHRPECPSNNSPTKNVEYSPWFNLKVVLVGTQKKIKVKDKK